MPNIWKWEYPEPCPLYSWIQGKDKDSLILDIVGGVS